jgi:predicted nuclease of restriction endonuclease-like (RecB) superfamily
MKPKPSTLQKQIYEDIKTILEQAKHQVVKSVNFTMVMAYWQVGKRIVEEEQGGLRRAAYGEGLIESLAGKLTRDFGKGFDARELRKIRQFYLCFPNRDAVRPKSEPLQEKEKEDAVRPIFENVPPSLPWRENLSWSHYRLLIRVESEAARAYYMHEAAENHWSTRTLERQINSLYYERLLSSKNKKPLQEAAQKEAANDPPGILDFVKDPYVLEFLNLSPTSTLFEKELETALLDKIQMFLLELGKGFSFVARQRRIVAEEETFAIDLVFYNYILKCFVLIDLKAGKLTHQDIGQMDFYVRYFEEEEKQPADNPTIGIILCTEKNEAIVRYSILKESKQVFASKYKLYLPSEKELKHELEQELRNIALRSGR